MKKRLAGLLLSLVFLMFSMLLPQVVGAQGQVLGIHILNPSELSEADQLISAPGEDAWSYVTIPLTLDDLEKQDEWQRFFDEAKSRKIIPLVRLATRFENGAWKIPNKKEVVDQITFLDRLNWPTEDRYIMVFNEVNHAKEWGGRLDPVGYAKTFEFAAQWAHAEDRRFRVMPAAMDLAAPSGAATREAFSYLNDMLAYDSAIFGHADYWNSHSYPNPGFSSSPERTAKNSLRGFQHELDFLKEKTGREYQVFITETGWTDNAATRRWLTQYYRYAIDHIWSDPRIMAVTPFVLKGDPGPFSSFGFIDREGKPTRQYLAYREALEELSRQ